MQKKGERFPFASRSLNNIERIIFIKVFSQILQTNETVNMPNICYLKQDNDSVCALAN